MARGLHANPAIGAVGGAHCEATIPVMGCAEMARGRHANPAIGTFGEALNGAPILVKVVPNWPEAAMGTLPLAPSVDLGMVP
eukprot:786784-Pyramimonas_sp.AAC.1